MSSLCPGERIVFDSQEEWDFYQWCVDAVKLGLIVDFIYHPDPIVLCPPVSGMVYKRKQRKDGTYEYVQKHGTLLRGHSYTPDFLLRSVWDIAPLQGTKQKPYYEYWIDVKGDWNIHNNHREFSINQKWVLQKAQLYVNKLVPKDFFAITFCPTVASYTQKTRQVKKAYKDCIRTEEMARLIEAGEVNFILPKMAPRPVNIETK